MRKTSCICNLPCTSPLLRYCGQRKIGSSKYKLKSYITHHGDSVEHGHYTSTILIENDKFVTFDDEKRSEEDTEPTNDPYLLFYERMPEDQSTEVMESDIGSNDSMDIEEQLSASWKSLSEKSETEENFQEQVME